MSRLSSFLAKLKKLKKSKGFALVATVVLLGVVTVSATVLISYILTGRTAGKFLEAEYSGIQVAEAGVQKAIYCIKETDSANCGGAHGDSYVGESNVAFGSGSFTVNVTDSGDGKVVSSTGTGTDRKVVTIVVALTEDSVPEKSEQLDFAVQAGDHGVAIDNNAEVNNGPIHSNSNIDCMNGAVIEEDIYVAVTGGIIDNCEIGGEAHADNILRSTVSGDCYYNDSFNASTCAGTQYPTSPTPMPIDMPDVNLAFWRAAAEAGGVISEDYAPEEDIAIGPIKIEGDLTLGVNIDVILTGPVWVTGNILLENGSSLTLHEDFGMYSTMVLADNPSDISSGGHINLENGSTVLGSGIDGSYIMFVSTNDSLNDNDPAIEIRNNATGGVFIALNGLVHFWNNADAAAIVGESVHLENNAIINYDNIGLTPEDITVWDATQEEWRFLEHSWREI